MNPPAIIPMIITEHLAEVRTFYVDVVGATPTIDMDGYLQVRLDDAVSGPEIAFMTPGSAPAGDIAALERFAGRGVVLSVAVADVDAEHQRLTAAGAQPQAAPQDRPWGWRSFLLADPSGVVLDIFTPVAQPAAV